MALDIHNNAGGGDGAEVYHSINYGIGKELADNILDEIKKIGQIAEVLRLGRLRTETTSDLSEVLICQ